MYRVTFQRHAGEIAVMFRLNSWGAVLDWLKEMPNLHEVNIVKEDV